MTEQYRPGKLTAPALISNIASMAITGASVRQIAAKLEMAPFHVRKLMLRPEFKAEIDSIAAEAKRLALQNWESELHKLTRKAVKVFHDKLDEGNLQAAIEVAKMAGALDKNKPTTQEANITVVLPGAPQEKAIETVSEVREVGDSAVVLADGRGDGEEVLE